MAPRIASDPNADVCPEFASADWAGVRRDLALPGESDKQTALRLTTTWTAINARQRLLWAAQVASDARTRQVGKTKPSNLPALNKARAAPNYPTYVPSRYAIDRLTNFEYVELWHFTREGCQRSLAVEGLASPDEVVQDADLTWSQMSVGMIVMLDEMKKCGWEADFVDSVTAFYRALDAHPYRFRQYGETALLRYQASVRRSWYDSFRGGEAFNIGLFNETLLQNIMGEHLRNLQVAAMAEAENMMHDRLSRDGSRDRSPSPRRRSASPRQRRPRARSPNARASRPGLPVCALCLARGHPGMSRCTADVLWDGTPTRCWRSADGKIVNPDGVELCFSWQLARGCNSRRHDDRHECSGCGDADHGAQECYLAEAI